MDMTAVRGSLLTLHQALVEAERRDYEKTHGRMVSADFLQALVNEPAFAWLAPLTTLLVALDELKKEEAPAWQAEARKLLSAPSEFQRRYAERIQASPEVAFAHGAAMRALRN